jgi:heme exporter protein B
MPYLPMLWAGFILGGAAFSAAGLLGAALTLGSRRNTALQALLVLPLCVPPLIFGAGTIAAAQLDLGPHAPLAFLAAITCAYVTLSPFAAASILRMKTISA